jgi:hypothetical protein
MLRRESTIARPAGPDGSLACVCRQRERHIMATRADFTEDEWRQLQFAPFWVFTAVAAIDGKVDEKEMMALAKELGEAHLFKEPLVRDVLQSCRDQLQEIMKGLQVKPQIILEGLGHVADLLDRKTTPEEANNFKGAMLLIAKKVAEASGGGFLGVGAKVSDDEKLAIVSVATAMRFKTS